MNTAWDPDNVVQRDSEIALVLDTDDRAGKHYSGAEIQSHDFYGYGRYELTIRASGETGVNSAFFIYTGPYFGDSQNEVDIEFLGKDPTRVWLNYFGEDGSWQGEHVDLGFDASEAAHDYAVEWTPDAIRWYADDRLLLEETGEFHPLPDEPGKIYMSIWTGQTAWLGAPDFEGSTEAVISNMSFTPLGDAPATVPDEVRQIALLYDAAFDRAPDAAGLNYWVEQIDAGISAEEVSEAFLLSDEFAAEAAPPEPGSEGDFIDDLYEIALGRPADATGLAFWLEALESNAMSRAEMLLTFAEAQENVSTCDFLADLHEVSPGEWDL